MWELWKNDDFLTCDTLEKCINNIDIENRDALLCEYNLSSLGFDKPMYHHHQLHGHPQHQMTQYHHQVLRR